MFYHHRFMFGSIDSASACAESSFVRRRRAPSLWGFGAAAGLLSFPLRARSGSGGLVALVVLAGCGSDSGGGGDGGGDGGGGGAMNMAPTVVTTTTGDSVPAPATLTATEEAAASWDVSDWFADPDEGDDLTYAATLQGTDAAMAAALPSWLVLNAMTGELTIAADATDDAKSGPTRFW